MITIVGLGFVGLTTALGFCHKGFRVFGYDIDKEKTGALNKNTIPFFEPHLGDILKEHNNKDFIITDSLNEAVAKSRTIFFCVGTPCRDDGSSDLSILLKAVEDVVKAIPGGERKIFVIKSTVPPSTTAETVKPFIEKMGLLVGKDVGLANNPEFLREGFAWEDFINPDRVVIGQDDEESGDFLEELYKPFEAPVFRVSLNTGEFIKYLSNTLLSTMISYSNEMSMIAHEVGNIDIIKAFRILHLDRRWFGTPAKMTSYVYPGCGFGGYCLPKDTEALHILASRKGVNSPILKSVLETNREIKKYVVKSVSDIVPYGEPIGILGLSFKAQSDDIRQTPVADIIKLLLEAGYGRIIAYDPLACENFKKAYNFPIEYADSLQSIAQRAGYLLLLTAWDEFRKQKALLQGKTVFDFRYFLE